MSIADFRSVQCAPLPTARVKTRMDSIAIESDDDVKHSLRALISRYSLRKGRTVRLTLLMYIVRGLEVRDKRFLARSTSNPRISLSAFRTLVVTGSSAARRTTNPSGSDCSSMQTAEVALDSGSAATRNAKSSANCCSVLKGIM